MAQSVKRPTLAQAMISHFRSSSPVSGSVLKAHGLRPASDSVSPLLSAPPLFMLCLSVINKRLKNIKKKRVAQSSTFGGFPAIFSATDF